mgnify:CR=1 FL=1
MIVTVFAAVVEYSPEPAAVSLNSETVTVPAVGVFMTIVLAFAAVTTEPNDPLAVAENVYADHRNAS